MMVARALLAVLLLGAAGVAQASAVHPSDIILRGPNQLPFNVVSKTYVPFALGATTGGAAATTGFGVVVGKTPIVIDGVRQITPAQLATTARIASRLLGPALLVEAALWTYEQLADPLETTGLIWTENDGWQQNELPAKWAAEPEYSGFKNLNSGQMCTEAHARGGHFHDPTWGPVNGFSGAEYVWIGGTTAAASAAGSAMWPPGSCPGDNPNQEGRNAALCYAPISGVVKDCRGVGGPTMVPRNATDGEIEDAIFHRLVSAETKGALLAGKLVEAGHLPTTGSTTTTGPSSVTGDTETVTTTDDLGQTTTTTTTTTSLSYDGDTVTATTTTTATTVHPDLSETVTTVVTGGQGEASPMPEAAIPLCEQFPDASGCEPLGEPAPFELEEEERLIALDVPAGSGGSCPAPMTFTFVGNTYEISWGPFCTFATGMRPVVVGMAMLGAGFFLASVGRSS